MFFKNLCILVLWTKVASALEGLRLSPWQQSWKSVVSVTGFWKVIHHLLMSTNMTGFRCFSKIFASLWFGCKLSQHWKGKMSLLCHCQLSQSIWCAEICLICNWSFHHHCYTLLLVVRIWMFVYGFKANKSWIHNKASIVILFIVILFCSLSIVQFNPHAAGG